MVKVIAVSLSAATAIVGVVTDDIPALVSSLGSASILAWYLYYDVRHARPARTKERAAADAARDAHVERVLSQYRNDYAEQQQIVSHFHERQISTQQAAIDELRSTNGELRAQLHAAVTANRGQ